MNKKIKSAPTNARIATMFGAVNNIKATQQRSSRRGPPYITKLAELRPCDSSRTNARVACRLTVRNRILPDGSVR